MTDLRLTFDEDPEVYDRVRPAYPPQLFDDFSEMLGDAMAPEICEVGAGTGKATESLLNLGAQVTGVEIGASNAAFLRRKFRGRAIEIVHASYESAVLRGGYGATVAATAWHWLDPATRLVRSASLLADHGVLAIVDTNQVESPVDQGYFAASQAIYARHGDHAAVPMPGRAVVPPAFNEVLHTPLFGMPELRRYDWDQTYTRADYQDLMRSYSGMRAMGVERREALIAELGEFIDAEFGGRVTRPLVITLVAARKA